MILPYDERGEGPALVLLHAGVADRREWTGMLDLLAQGGVRALAPDLPEYGEAGAAPGPQAPWQDVLETLDSLDIGRFALAGNSFGGAVAKRVAALVPEQISALALISAPPEADEPSPRLRAVWESEEEAIERGDVDAAVAVIVGSWTLPDASPQLKGLVAEMQRRAYDLQLQVEPQDGPDPLEDAPQALAALQAPVLLAVGEHDFEDFHQEARRLQEQLPGARLETIAGAGHLAPLEQPEQTARLLLSMLDAGA